MSNGAITIPQPLPFETTVSEIDQQILTLQEGEGAENYEEELESLRKTRNSLLEKMYENRLHRE